jgi:hypothetical protein
MKVFLISVVAAVVIAVGGFYVLNTYQLQADQAFTTSAVRLPDHGTIQNLVGRDWPAPKQ